MRTLAISSGTVAVLLVLGVLDVFAVVLGLSFMRARRTQRRTVGDGRAPGPAPVARRDFLRRSLLVSLTAFGAQFGRASLAFLWPNLQGGFGATIPAGTVDSLKSQ